MNGKGDKQRPTDHNKWSNNYDNIKWTKEKDEDRLQDRTSAQCSVATARSETDSQTTGATALEKP